LINLLNLHYRWCRRTIFYDLGFMARPARPRPTIHYTLYQFYAIIMSKA